MSTHEELERVKRIRDRFIQSFRELRMKYDKLKTGYNELAERKRRLEEEKQQLQGDLEYYKSRAWNWQQQAETLQDKKRRDNLSSNF